MKLYAVAQKKINFYSKNPEYGISVFFEEGDRDYYFEEGIVSGEKAKFKFELPGEIDDLFTQDIELKVVHPLCNSDQPAT